MHLQTRKARPGVETRTGWPLSTAGCHRPDGDCHHDEVGRDGVHRGCETDDDDRHQPHVQAAARPPFLICAWRILCSKPRREWTRQRRPAVAGRSDRVPAKGKPKAVLLRALRGASLSCVGEPRPPWRGDACIRVQGRRSWRWGQGGSLRPAAGGPARGEGGCRSGFRVFLQRVDDAVCRAPDVLGCLPDVVRVHVAPSGDVEDGVGAYVESGP